MREQEPGRRINWILLGIIAAGIGLRLYCLGHKCFWQDEGVTWYIGRGIIHEDASPFLYYFLLNKFQLLFGGSEFAGRLVSVLSGTLFIPLVYVLAEKLFDKRAALISAFIVSISPYAIAVSQEMRMYSLLGLELIGTFYFFQRILEKSPHEPSGIRWWIGLFIISVMGLYTHLLFAFMFLFFTATFFLLNVRRFPRRLINWALLLLAMGLVYLPELSKVFSRAGVRRHVWVEATFPALLDNVILMFRSLATFVFGFRIEFLQTDLTLPQQSPLNLFILLLGVSLVIGLGIALMITIRQKYFAVDEYRRGIFLMAAFILFNLVLFLFLEVSSTQQLIILYIPFVLLLGLLLARLSSARRIGFLVLICLFAALALWNYYPLPYFPYEEADWREAGEFLAASAAPEDLIFIVGGRNVLYTLLYYCADLSSAMLYLNNKFWEPDPYQVDLPIWRERQPEPYIRDRLAEYARVWYVDLSGGSDFPKKFPSLRPEFIRQFGSLLSLYCLSPASL